MDWTRKFKLVNLWAPKWQWHVLHQDCKLISECMLLIYIAYVSITCKSNWISEIWNEWIIMQTLNISSFASIKVWKRNKIAEFVEIIPCFLLISWLYVTRMCKFSQHTITLYCLKLKEASLAGGQGFEHASLMSKTKVACWQKGWVVSQMSHVRMIK